VKRIAQGPALVRPVRIAGAAVAALGIVALALPGAVHGADDGDSGDVEVVNTETVQVYMDASGKIDSRRVYEQLTLTGQGTVDVANPVEESGLRNLNGFSGFDVEDGVQTTTVDVDGVERLRSVSDFDGDLPLEVEVAYELDGERVDPEDVVGADGALEVTYTVRNVTATEQQVTFTDGKGGTITETAEVPIPMVGSLTTVAPPGFADVASDQANMAGDGKGGTRLSFTMTLFPPLGSDEVSFGYTANINDGVVPDASISALPVNPLQSPTFKTAGDSYKSGSDTGVRLAEGATEIDSNLLRLRDGAAELLGGLLQLSDGADRLNAGLAGEAAPGAQRLADGAGQLDDGMSQLDAGLGDLDAGAHRLAAGTDKALTGSRKLANGAERLEGGLVRLDGGAGQLGTGAEQLAVGQQALAEGLKKLYDGVDTLPGSVRQKLQTDASYQALLGALQSIADGVGTRADAPTATTLLGGINAIQYGLDNPAATAAACDAKDTTRCGATDALDRIGERLFGAINGPATADGTVAKLKATIESIKNDPLGGTCDPLCEAYVQAVADGVANEQTNSLNQLRDGVLAVSDGVKSQLLAPNAGLDRLRFGLSNPGATNCLAAKQTATPADDCGIKEAALFIRNTGIPALVDGITTSISAELKAGIGVPTKDCDPEATLRCAAAALADGGNQLTAGVDKLVAGVVKLSEGGQLLSAGATELSTGLGKIEGGTDRLAAGTSKAQSGSSQLAAGTGRLAAGAGELADGLGDAADGSGRLADGLDRAAEGAPQIVEGARRLSDEGMSKLVDAGEDTAQDYGKMYAVLASGAERADAEKMAYGAPEGARGLTAYSFELVGDDGEGGRNATRGLVALVLLGAGLGALGLRRRFA
jgi:putative membrane protein